MFQTTNQNVSTFQSQKDTTAKRSEFAHSSSTGFLVVWISALGFQQHPMKYQSEAKKVTTLAGLTCKQTNGMVLRKPDACAAWGILNFRQQIFQL